VIDSLRRFLNRVRSLFRKRELEDDLNAELTSHLEFAIEDYLRSGHSREEARRLAMVDLGGLTVAKEQHRDARGLPWLEDLLQDARYALRTLRRDAGATMFAILIVGLGVGASATVFSVVNALLLRPLPFQEPERLVWLSNIADDGVGEWQVQVKHHLDLREQTTSFSDLAGYYAPYGSGNSKLTGDGEPQRVTRVPVTCNFLPLLGVQPHLGRNFTREECQQNGSSAVLLSFGLWQRRYAGDPAIIGRSITIDTATTVVAGILPPSFDFASVFDPGRQMDLVSPFPLSEQTNRQGNVVAVVGRLKRDVTIEEARAEFQVLGKRLTEAHSERNTLRPKLTRLDERVSGRFRPALLVLAGAVTTVMLIVCANLSNLQLSRMATRQKEIAIRAALGASRGRLVRQLLTENILLSLGGGLLGFALAVVGTRAIAGLEAFSIPLLRTVELDSGACGFLVLLAVCTGIGFGLLPALRVPASAPQRTLKDKGRGASEGPAQAAMQAALLAAEVAFACVLLLGSALLMRSFLQVLDVALGFQPERVAALRIDGVFQLSSQMQRNAHIDEVLRRMREAPGIGRAALADVLPLGGNRSRGVAGEGQVYARDRYPQGYLRVVSDGYFATMGIRLRSGREITSLDTPDREPVVIVNETMARMLWPGKEGLGQILAHGGGTKRRVVGVVSDVRHVALDAGFTGEVYLPFRQTNDYSSVNVIVRTDLSAAPLATVVRSTLLPIEPNLAVNQWRTLDELVNKAISPRRFLVLFLAGFAAFALALASLGIYAVISYSVSQRQKEIGIRMALGASARNVQWRVLGQTLRLVGIGLALGLAVFRPLGLLMEGLLFGVKPHDTFTLIAVPLVLASTAALAGYLPARRAAHLDPMAALRTE
jgi:predicted permease